MRVIIPKPNPKQAEFFRSRTKYTGYGGARGGGKSWAVRQKAKMLALKYAGIRILILRRTYPDLQDNHIRPMVSDCKGFASYTDKSKTMLFVNGSTVKFGYFASQNDELQYQGQEYDIIFIDEATQFAESVFTTLKACLRGVNEFPKRIYLTCNPGGIGHLWVKRLFIDRDFRNGEDPSDYTFIQAKVHDNAALMESDPGYIKMLESQPPGRREAWLEGRWDVYEGQYFRDWNPDIHVCAPFPIPSHWRIYRSIDYGLDMLACLWTALSDSGEAYVIRELHKSDLIVSQAAEEICDFTDAMRDENGDPIKIYDTLAPPDLWARTKDSGKMTAEIFRDCGVPLVPAANNRVFGWQSVAEYLKPIRDVDGGTTSRIHIFDNCRNLIRNLPQLQYDPRNPDDCSTEPHEITHICDALRYFCVTHTVSPSPVDGRSEERKMLDDYKKKVLRSGQDRRRVRF